MKKKKQHSDCCRKSIKLLSGSLFWSCASGVICKHVSNVGHRCRNKDAKLVCHRYVNQHRAFLPQKQQPHKTLPRYSAYQHTYSILSRHVPSPRCPKVPFHPRALGQRRTHIGRCVKKEEKSTSVQKRTRGHVEPHVPAPSTEVFRV